MKKKFTLFVALMSVISLNAQVELIRNGDFSLGVTPSASIKDIASWNMDMVTPASGWWDLHVGLTSTDTTLYQVVETISTDSVLYTLAFNGTNTWLTDKIIAIASVTEADSTIRTRIASAQLAAPIDIATNFEFKFGFSKDSPYAGKKLVIEFDLTSTTAEGAWLNLDNVSMKKVIAGINSAPVAEPGPPQNVKGGELVTLDASASTDFEGSALTYKWVSVYPGIFLSDKTAVKPTFIAPDVTELTTFEFTLVVNDGELNSELVITSVTVSPAGELIRNGGFELTVDGSAATSTSLKDIAFWNIDALPADLNGGRYGGAGLRFANLASLDPPIYQVLKTIGDTEATFNLSFSARSSWNAQSTKTLFSVSDADSSVRTVIDSSFATFDIDVPNGINSTTMKTFTHVLVIPANSVYAGKKLIIEFENIPYADGNDDGWLEMDNVSLIEASASSVKQNAALNLILYPNPATNILYIQSVSKITRVDIYSVSGNLEKSVLNPDIRKVELGGLSKGLHFICLKSESGTITKKLIVK